MLVCYFMHTKKGILNGTFKRYFVMSLGVIFVIALWYPGAQAQAPRSRYPRTQVPRYTGTVYWVPGYLGTWVPGYLGTWVPGYLGARVPGYHNAITKITL